MYAGVENVTIATIIIIGLSCYGSTPAKLASVNVIGGSGFLARVTLIWFMLLMVHKCLVRANLVPPLPAKPLTIMLITSHLPPPWIVEVPTWSAWLLFVLAFHQGLFVLSCHDNFLSPCPNLYICPCCY